MASLIDDARATRDDAVRARTRAVALRLTTRQVVRTAQERMATASASRARLHGVLDAPAPSPWSGLEWRHRDESLEQTLVPLP